MEGQVSRVKKKDIGACGSNGKGKKWGCQINGSTVHAHDGKKGEEGEEDPRLTTELSRCTARPNISLPLSLQIRGSTFSYYVNCVDRQISRL